MLTQQRRLSPAAILCWEEQPLFESTAISDLIRLRIELLAARRFGIKGLLTIKSETELPAD
jgi:hypothetical protein